MKREKLPPFPTPRALPALSEALRAQAIALPPARTADMAWITDLHAGARMAELLFAPWPPAQKRAFLDEQFALQHAHFVQAHRKGDFRIVTRAGAPIGRFYFNRSAPEWVLIEILLSADAQGGGIGAMLVAWLQQAATDAGAESMRLSVAHDNPRARALYRRLGFEDAGDVAGTHHAMRWRPIRP
jgi:RimJ/RimL family protein N-acetyltransferase